MQIERLQMIVRLISWSEDSTASDPWIILRPTQIEKEIYWKTYVDKQRIGIWQYSYQQDSNSVLESKINSQIQIVIGSFEHIMSS